MVLTLLLACLLAAPVFAPPRSFSEVSVSEVEQHMFVLTNDERRQRGLRPLQTDDSLARAARLHSEDMLTRNYFSHDTPEGRTADERVRAIDRRLIGRIGENIWEMRGQEIGSAARIAATVVGAWMDSPAHRANILNPDFSHLGMGVAIARGRILATQDFADVRAILKSPLPETITEGRYLFFEIRTFNHLPRPQQVDFVSSNGNVTLGPEPLDQRLPVSKVQVTARPGTYQLRFYFPHGTSGNEVRRYEVVPGPQIRVK